MYRFLNEKNDLIKKKKDFFFFFKFPDVSWEKNKLLTWENNYYFFSTQLQETISP